MIDDINTAVLEQILRTIPDNVKPVGFFMDILDISRESAYRRLRGEKPLSFGEIYKLASELDLSLDEMAGYNRPKTAVFNYVGDLTKEPEKNLLEFLQYYEGFLSKLVAANNSEVVLTVNRLLHIMICGYDQLTKFVYYRWYHQINESPVNNQYAKFIIPEEIFEVSQRIVKLLPRLHKISYIIDNNLFLNTVKDIQYFYVRGLITPDELNLIKEDYLRFLNTSELSARKGLDHHGNVTDIYLSVFDITNSTTYTTWNNIAESAFWQSPAYPLMTRNKEITTRHRAWIDSMKKYTTVISQSNELQRADFFNKQRGHINNLSDKILLL